MGVNRKYLVAVALLAVLAVVFGLAGTVAPVELVSPQQSTSSSSDPLTHFMNPPTYDSDWVNITDERGRSFTLTHDLIDVHPLPEEETLVDVVGRRSLAGGNHKLFFGSTYVQGWKNTYGGTSWEEAWSVVETNDGGFALAGVTESYGAGFGDFWLVKTDSAGTLQWNRTYGGADFDWATCVIQTSDGGYAMAGRTYSFGAGSFDAWLVKTDSAGIMDWNQTYGGISDDEAWSVVETDDGGYALAGFTASYSVLFDYDAWLVKVNSFGFMDWNKTYGGANNDGAFSIVETSDGGYALGGSTDSFGAGDGDFWLVKTNSAGTLQWNQTYGGTEWNEAYSVVETSDGGFALAGFTESFGAGPPDFWLVKTDSAGNMDWNSTYGGEDVDVANSVVETSDGGFALAGFTESIDDGNPDFWLVKTDSTGNMEWDQTYGGPMGEEAYSVVETSDGGYALAGFTDSFGANLTDFWLVKAGEESGFSIGLSMIDFTYSNITFYRGSDDPYWNYLRVRIWIFLEPTWMFGDINQDGIVDAQDLAILGKNYGKTFSALSLTGILAITGIYTYKKRKKQPE